MHQNNGTIDSTDLATRMRNITAEFAKESYDKNKRTMTIIATNEQIDADIAKNWFLVLERDAKRIKVGDVLVRDDIHYTVTKTDNDVNDGFVAFHFVKAGTMKPARRRRDLE